MDKIPAINGNLIESVHVTDALFAWHAKVLLFKYTGSPNRIKEKRECCTLGFVQFGVFSYLVYVSVDGKASRRPCTCIDCTNTPTVDLHERITFHTFVYFFSL